MTICFVLGMHYTEIATYSVRIITFNFEFPFIQGYPETSSHPYNFIMKPETSMFTGYFVVIMTGYASKQIIGILHS